MKQFALALAGIILLTGCRLGSPYKIPNIDTPESWKASHEVHSIESPVLDDWWEVFGDETLNSLEQQALINNPTLYSALESVIQARATVGVRNADLYPQITLDPQFTYSENYDTVFFPKNFKRIIPPTIPLSPNFKLYQMEFKVPFDLSYQVDLWRKLRGQFESAFYSAEAQEEAYYTTLLTLTTDLASAYFQMRTLDAQIELYRDTIENRRKSLTLNESRYKKGLANYIDVTNATLQLSNVEASYYDTLRQRAIQEDTIATLIGTAPAEIYLDPIPLERLPPKIPAGIPSKILLRRPDIAEAERTMASQHALIGVAYASFFPSLTLNGAVGAEAGQIGFFGQHFKTIINWKSFVWNAAAYISQTIFDAGRNCANLAGAKSAFRQAVDNYQQQVLTAFREVEDALNNLDWQDKQARSLENSVEAAKTTTQLSTKRYNKGLVTYLEVVSSEQAELEAESNWIISLGARYLSTVQLIKALGGGWDSDPCQF